jgi:anti-sigma regulatory factor (Ser/Thr protein kinase)
MTKSKFSADFANLDAIREFVGQAAEQAGFSGKEVYAVQLAADEACSNVIEHAYAGQPDGEIEIDCEVVGGQITIVIHDHGKEFDITKVRKPNLSKDLGERQVGGLGVFLIYKLMDEVCFQSSKETGNILTMVKRKSGKP